MRGRSLGLGTRRKRRKRNEGDCDGEVRLSVEEEKREGGRLWLGAWAMKKEEKKKWRRIGDGRWGWARFLVEEENRGDKNKGKIKEKGKEQNNLQRNWEMGGAQGG
jgi:hypothetical protein